MQFRLMILKHFMQKNFSPSVARMHVVGALDKEAITKPLDAISTKIGKRKRSKFPNMKRRNAPTKSKIYFYDVPDAKQSVIRFGYPALAQTDKDFYPATMMNYILGGGGFASQLTQQLREGKGYTYGIRLRF